MTAASPTRRSIQTRLAVQLMAGAAVLSFLLIFFVRGLAQQLAEESQDNVLAASLTSILDTAAFIEEELVLDLPYTAFSMLDTDYDDAIYYAIYSGDEFQSGYGDLPIDLTTQTTELSFDTITYRGTQIRMVKGARAIARGDGLVLVRAALGQTRSAQDIATTRATQSLTALGLTGFAIAVLLALLASRSAMQPMARLARQLGKRGPDDLRPFSEAVPQEMYPLAAALNRFMGRLDTALSRSEDFITEAAHRVRSPLAEVRMQAELTLSRVDKDANRQSLRDMIRAVDESSRAAGQLLDHAMVSVRTDHLERNVIDLCEITQDVVARQRPTAALRDIEILEDLADDVSMRGDAILIQNALTNILDNAIKYSPPDSEIRVTVAVDGSKACVVIEDNGPGFPKGIETDLTERFVRGSNSEGVVGSGLGLTIVDEIVRAHDGELALGASQKGEGACVTLRFPHS